MAMEKYAATRKRREWWERVKKPQIEAQRRRRENNAKRRRKAARLTTVERFSALPRELLDGSLTSPSRMKVSPVPEMSSRAKFARYTFQRSWLAERPAELEDIMWKQLEQFSAILEREAAREDQRQALIDSIKFDASRARLLRSFERDRAVAKRKIEVAHQDFRAVITQCHEYGVSLPRLYR